MKCDHCGEEGEHLHYLTHVCPDCTCVMHWTRDPYEPQIPAMPEPEWNPDCPVHRKDQTP